MQQTLQTKTLQSADAADTFLKNSLQHQHWATLVCELRSHARDFYYTLLKTINGVLAVKTDPYAHYKVYTVMYYRTVLRTVCVNL